MILLPSSAGDEAWLHLTLEPGQATGSEEVLSVHRPTRVADRRTRELSEPVSRLHSAPRGTAHFRNAISCQICWRSQASELDRTDELRLDGTMAFRVLTVLAVTWALVAVALYVLHAFSYVIALAAAVVFALGALAAKGLIRSGTPRV